MQPSSAVPGPETESRARRRRRHQTGDAPAATQVVLRLRFAAAEPVLGPGKIELMEHIEREGSISAAGRAMGMSYHRACVIVGEINTMFREPLIETRLGGPRGGGARITPLGQDVVSRYRSIETTVWRHAATQIAALEAAIHA